MNLTDLPTVAEWDSLETIVYAAEVIVADAPHAPRGLLDLLINGESKPGSISTLKSNLKGPVVLFQSEAKKIVKILPGIDEIGFSRQSRIDNLWVRLGDLNAFRWLKSQPGFTTIFDTLDRIAKTNPSFKVDTRYFLLLDAFIWPLHFLALQQKLNLTPQYPTRKDLKDARSKAGALSAFLKANRSIHGIVDVPLALKESLSKFALELDSVERTYRKPRDDGGLRERDFGDQIIRAINANFGKCSPTLVGRLLTFVDYPSDDSDLKARIKKITEPARRKALAKALRGG